MKDIRLKSSLVSVDWLHEHLEAPNLIVLDASLPKAGMGEDSLSQTLIQGARFMDLKSKWSQKDAPFPNTMLDAKSFERVARDLGINDNSALVFYDQHGIYSSARGWHMFRAMGHDNVAVLDGGLPSWEKAGFPVMSKTRYTGEPGDFHANPLRDYFVAKERVQACMEDDSKLVLDARARDRFLGLVAEPREGLRSGHIPGSKSLPYADLEVEGKMMDPDALKSIFDRHADEKQDLIFSCGSGITACVLALGAELAGRSGYSVYDGSWTEWGSLPELPIEKDEAR
jgi:thiosulfate/3-mercaptopyruvate sulfurtransferase